jgi:hypothetical protein
MPIPHATQDRAPKCVKADHELTNPAALGHALRLSRSRDTVTASPLESRYLAPRCGERPPRRTTTPPSRHVSDKPTRVRQISGKPTNQMTTDNMLSKRPTNAPPAGIFYLITTLGSYSSCRFSSFMSRRVALNCADGGVLTLCPPRRFSISCPLLEWCVSRMQATGRLSAVRPRDTGLSRKNCSGLSLRITTGPSHRFSVLGLIKDV